MVASTLLKGTCGNRLSSPSSCSHTKPPLSFAKLCARSGLPFEKSFWGFPLRTSQCWHPVLKSWTCCPFRAEASSSTFQERYGAEPSESRTSTSKEADRWSGGSRFSSKPPPPDLERMHGFLPRIGLQGGHEFPGGKMKKAKQKGLSDSQRRARRKETRIKNLIQRKKDIELLPPPPELTPEEKAHVREAAQMVVKAMVIIWQYMPALLYHIPVQVCNHCTELHVGPIGHDVRSCRGFGAEKRQASHQWRPARLKDVLPIHKAYHLWHRLAPPPSHNLQSQWGRVPAIMELCFQAGAEVPGLETSAVGQADGLHPTTRLKLLGVAEQELQSVETKEGKKLFPEDALNVINEVRERLGIEDERPEQPYDAISKAELAPSLSFMFDEYRIFVRGEPDVQKEVDEKRLSDPRFLKRLHIATELAQQARRKEREGDVDQNESEKEEEVSPAVAKDGGVTVGSHLAQAQGIERASRIGDGEASISDGGEAEEERLTAEIELRDQIDRAQELYLAELAGFGSENEEELESDSDQDADKDSDAAYSDRDEKSDLEDSETDGALEMDELSSGEWKSESCSRRSDNREFVGAPTSGDVTDDCSAVTRGKRLSERDPEERKAIKKLRRELREKHFAEQVMGDLSLQEVAENVLLARQVVVDNLPDILQWYEAMRCRFCEEFHVGPRGHRVRTCRGMQHPHRKGAHEWRPANQDELFPPLDVYHMDDVNALPPQHLEIYPLKEFDNEGNFLFRHEPERKWMRWPLIVEMCVQAGAKAPEDVLERTTEFERLYIEQGKVMHRAQFTQLYGMLGFEAPYGEEAWSETGPKNVKKPSYVIPGKQMPSRLGGTRHIKKEGPYFDHGIVDRWVRGSLRYDDMYGLEEDESASSGEGEALQNSEERVAFGDSQELAGRKTVSFNGVELRVVKDGLRNLPRSQYIKMLTKAKQREKQRLENEPDASRSADLVASGGDKEINGLSQEADEGRTKKPVESPSHKEEVLRY